MSETTREGSSLLNIADAAENLGFKTLGVKISSDQLSTAPLPCILLWENNHYVVLYKVRKGNFFLSDPARGLFSLSLKEFERHWIADHIDGQTVGIALLLEPTVKFERFCDDTDSKEGLGISFLFRYAKPYKKFLLQIVFGILAGSLIQLAFPLLTQSIVDVGIKNSNLNFIYLVLFAQLFLSISGATLDILRGWIIVNLSSRLSISLISDFFIKLMNLPISFFDTKMTGDIIQRIYDHQRIEKIITDSSLNVLFSSFNVLVFGALLAYYSLQIFVVFVIGSFFYLSWISIFLKKRKQLDHRKFYQSSKEQDKMIELVNGMQEIKLHNAERQKRWGWENIQVRLYHNRMNSLTIEQAQNVGSNIINEIKNVVIIFLSAKFVVEGQITLGVMMAITSVAGALNSPVLQLVGFIREWQDAKLSIARFSEIHSRDDEKQLEKHQTNSIPENGDVTIDDLSFKYLGSDQEVLANLSLTIPYKKITAIVGTSGSGKTTLLKLLLKFYEPTGGRIAIGKTALQNISHKAWRDYCGTVMQEGFIFDDTIAGNVAVGVDDIDKRNLFRACEIANMTDFVDTAPLGYNTVIGNNGHGLSTGQKQRILIARAIYKNPQILLFDEATSSLDANNEKEIMSKLNTFFIGKTVVIIAHRLSTVMNADQIVVLEKGKIVEVGTHDELIASGKNYYDLVKNQLQLGK